MNWLSKVVIHRTGWVVGILVAASVALGSQIPNLTADFTPSDLFGTFEDQEAIAEEFRETFGNTDNIITILVQADNILELENVQYIHDLSVRFQTEEMIGRVESITVTAVPHPPEAPDGDDPSGPTNGGILEQLSGIFGDRPLPEPLVAGAVVTEEALATMRIALADSPLLEGKLFSEDLTLSTVVLMLESGLTRNDQLADAVDRVEAVIDEISRPDGLNVFLGGLPFIRTTLVRSMRADQTVLIPMALGLCFLILLVAFRWLPAIALPILAVVQSAIMVVGAMAFVGEPFNIINNIVPMLVIIIGLSNGIHLITRYLEEYRATGDRIQASRNAFEAMSVACFLTSFTTAIGFYSLALSQTAMLRRFALTAGTGIVLVYIVTVTFLPAMLAKVSPPKRSRASRWRQSPPTTGLERALVWWTRGVIRRPWPILGLATLVLAGLVAAATTVEVDSAVLDQFDEDDEVAQTMRLLEERLSGIRPLEVSLSSTVDERFTQPDMVNTINEFMAWVVQQEGVLSASSFTNYLGETRYHLSNGRTDRQAPFTDPDQITGLKLLLRSLPSDPLRQYLTTDGTRARINVQVADIGANATLALTDRMDAQLEVLLGDFDELEYGLTGDAYISSRGLDVVIEDLGGSLSLAAIIIFGFMILLFRSVRLGLLSIPPNIIPLVGTLAYMALFGIPLNAATVIIFSVSIGLAVDGTIHVLARFREEIQAGRPPDQALTAAAQCTGRAIILTNVSLMLGFGVMLMSSFVPVRRFGTLIAITVFTCLIATLLVLPALLKVGYTPLRQRRSGAEGNDDSNSTDC